MDQMASDGLNGLAFYNLLTRNGRVVRHTRDPRDHRLNAGLSHNTTTSISSDYDIGSVASGNHSLPIGLAGQLQRVKWSVEHALGEETCCRTW